MRGNHSYKLLGFPLKRGDRLHDTILVGSTSFEDQKLLAFRGKVLTFSLVPSIVTKVCERQPHYLGEQGSRLPGDIERIAISRNASFSRNRFAKEAKVSDITFLSDYRKGDFGLATGLLVEDMDLLAKAILVADRSNVVRHMQIASQSGNRPDLETAFQKARNLDRQ